jgi:hypothetical protein
MSVVTINEGSVVSPPTGSSGAISVEPAISQVFAEAVRQRRRAAKCKQASKTALQLVFQDDTGNPINLATTPYSTIKARFRESVGLITGYAEATAEVISATTSEVKVEIPAATLAQAGIYLAEFGLLNADGEVLHSNDCFVFVENSAWGQQTHKGPPMLSEARMSLRDSDPAENELLGTCDFDLAENCYACTRSVLDWNEQPPMLVNAQFDSRNFPYRDIWLYGIQLYLFEMAAEHYRRNALPYSAGGVNLDDKNKHALYLQACADRRAEWRRMTQHQKIAININQGFRSILSGYPR